MLPVLILKALVAGQTPLPHKETQYGAWVFTLILVTTTIAKGTPTAYE